MDLLVSVHHGARMWNEFQMEDVKANGQIGAICNKIIALQYIHCIGL